MEYYKYNAFFCDDCKIKINVKTTSIGGSYIYVDLLCPKCNKTIGTQKHDDLINKPCIYFYKKYSKEEYKNLDKRKNLKHIDTTLINLIDLICKDKENKLLQREITYILKIINRLLK